MRFRRRQRRGAQEMPIKVRRARRTPARAPCRRAPERRRQGRATRVQVQNVPRDDLWTASTQFPRLRAPTHIHLAPLSGAKRSGGLRAREGRGRPAPASAGPHPPRWAPQPGGPNSAPPPRTRPCATAPNGAQARAQDCTMAGTLHHRDQRAVWRRPQAGRPATAARMRSAGRRPRLEAAKGQGNGCQCSNGANR